MRLKMIVRLSVSCLTCISLSQAAGWQTIDSRDGMRLDIDQSRIMRIDPDKSLAWIRLVTDQTWADEAGTHYSSMEVLNRYDCTRQRFKTVRRVYLQNGRPVKQESVSDSQEKDTTSSRVDGLLWSAACNPDTNHVVRSKDVARDGATTVHQPATALQAKAMHADVQQLAMDQPIYVRTASDVHGKTDTAAPLGKIALPSQAELAAKAASDKSILSSAPAPLTSPALTGTAPVAPAATPMPAPSPRAAPSYARFTQKKKLVVAKPAASTEPHPAVHWSYDGEGAPAHWGKLRPDYALCATGKRQSPIDIREDIRVDLAPIGFSYHPTHFRIIDNGHTVQVNVGEGSGIDIMGRHFSLVQMHFHRPSEERINGRNYDMVAHLVHKDLDGQLAVIAILLEKGAEHLLIQTLWNNMPLETGIDVVASDIIDLNLLLPENRTYWTYMGSLTTPPCNEGVLWMVLKQPQQISPEQIAIFSRLYRNNARPVQPSNNRLIKGSR